jgi:2-polyprenyl-3-methyl-5-hydroxy-6-metoxy-1,4-benzoquinol methylase
MEIFMQIDLNSVRETKLPELDSNIIFNRTKQNEKKVQEIANATLSSEEINVNNKMSELSFSASKMNRSVFADRPNEVQKEVDLAFKELNSSPAWWCYNGQESYQLVAINDAKMIRHIASRTDGKKDVYLLDVGCGKCRWGNQAAKLISSEFSQSSKHFHIISLTGEKESEAGIETQGNVTHYKFNQFKIENIEELLKEKNLNLTNQVDLIVSNWTLRHLVDPIGTLKQLYNLLTPKNGYLLSSDLLFSAIGSNSTLLDGEVLCKVFSQQNSMKMLFSRTSRDDSKKYEFLLLRDNEAPFDLPLKYTGKFASGGTRYDRISDQFCTYQLTSPIDDIDLSFEKDRYYGFYGDKKSKELYVDLEKKGLFMWSH